MSLRAGGHPISWPYADGCTRVAQVSESAGVSLGPIALSLGDSSRNLDADDDVSEYVASHAAGKRTATDAWREQNLSADGGVDLWLEDDFNASSRLAGGVALASGLLNVENKAAFGKDWDPACPVFTVKVTDPVTGIVLEIQAPEDRYILFEAEEQGLSLPNACRNGCCTQCAVKVKKGSLQQDQALGISKELRDQGYALLCVAYPDSDLEVELQDAEEVYEMQFGGVFAKRALDKSLVARDDFALELADMDE
jgi:ferredoxin